MFGFSSPFFFLYQRDVSFRLSVSHFFFIYFAKHAITHAEISSRDRDNSGLENEIC